MTLGLPCSAGLANRGGRDAKLTSVASRAPSGRGACECREDHDAEDVRGCGVVFGRAVRDCLVAHGLGRLLVLFFFFGDLDGRSDRRGTARWRRAGGRGHRRWHEGEHRGKRSAREEERTWGRGRSRSRRRRRRGGWGRKQDDRRRRGRRGAGGGRGGCRRRRRLLLGARELGVRVRRHARASLATFLDDHLQRRGQSSGADRDRRFSGVVCTEQT